MLASAAQLLLHPDTVASIWPTFSELRLAARVTKQYQLRLVVSALVADARVAFRSCLVSTLC